MIETRPIEYYTFKTIKGIISFVNKGGTVYIDTPKEHCTLALNAGEEKDQYPYAVVIENNDEDIEDQYWKGSLDWFKNILNQFGHKRVYKLVDGTIDNQVH